MKTQQRRNLILSLLRSHKTAVAGKALSEEFGVSRQIIVGDIAALREQGFDIISTHSGYALHAGSIAERVFKLRHTTEQTEDELNTIIDLGGIVKDVFVWHKVYGKVSATLGICSRLHVSQFIEGVRSGKSTELMNITGGYHYHTITAESETLLDLIEKALDEKGISHPKNRNGKGLKVQQLDSFFITDKGKIRRNNEDNYYLNENGLFAVSDGMGGESYGEKASAIAIEILDEYKDCAFYEYAPDYVERANAAVVEMSEQLGARSGATIAVLYINGDYAYCCNVGDSRIYLLRDGELIQLTEDHTKAAQMVSLGVLTPEQAVNHKDSHTLLQHLGIHPDDFVIEPYETELTINEGDIFLLCSDGLTDMLTDIQIRDVLCHAKNAKETAKEFVKQALLQGGRDNVTVGVVIC